MEQINLFILIYLWCMYEWVSCYFGTLTHCSLLLCALYCYLLTQQCERNLFEQPIASVTRTKTKCVVISEVDICLFPTLFLDRASKLHWVECLSCLQSILQKILTPTWTLKSLYRLTLILQYNVDFTSQSV